jgi:hypothetical protein
MKSKKAFKSKLVPAKRIGGPLKKPIKIADARPPIVGLFREQQKIRNQVARDRAQRYAAFLQQVDNPTEPAQLGMALRAMVPKNKSRAQRILAEGDSWFDYPLPWPQGDGVIYQLQKLIGYPIANMAHYGLEVEQMMGLSLRQEIISKLTDPNINYDALLFSGAGAWASWSIYSADDDDDLQGDDMHHMAHCGPIFGLSGPAAR